MRIKELLLRAVAVEVGASAFIRRRRATGAICVECVDRKSRAVLSGILLGSIHCSIFHALLPKCRETCEGRSGLVGPESNGGGRLSKKKEYTGTTIESYESRTAHFLYMLRLQGEQLGLKHSVFATTPAGWCIGLTVIGPRGITLRLERLISRDTRSVAFPFLKSV